MTASSAAPVRAPHNSRALAQLDVPGPIRAYLEKTLGQINELTEDPDALWEICSRGLQMETAYRILAGRALIKLREGLPGQQFSAGLAERDIPRRSAYEAIETYELFAALPNIKAVQVLASLGVTKAKALSHWTTEEHRAFAAGEMVRGITHDQAVEFSSRELQQQQREWHLEHDDQVAKLSKQIAQLKTQLDTTTNIKNQLARAGAALQTEEDLPHFALVVRQESFALTEQMSFALENLEAIAHEHLFSEVKHPEVHRWQPIAARNAYTALAAVVSRGQMLLNRISKEFRDAITVPITLDHQLTAAELKRFSEARDHMLVALKTQAKRRIDERENSRPGKRGAKRGARS